MRAFHCAAAAALSAMLSGCGYVGPIVPPSPQIPAPVTNLAAVQRGDQIVVTFSTPPRTTDSLAIDEFSNIDLRIGPASEPFDQTAWEQSAKPYAIPHQPAVEGESEVRSLPVTKSIPASDWIGKRVNVQVRTAVKKRGHFSAWSNRVALDVISPLAAPQLQVKGTADGYKLMWATDGRANKFQILRQGPGEKVSSVVGISDRPEYVDGTAQWEKTYGYNVVAQLSNTESFPSATVTVNEPDRFPPAVPSGVVALAGPDSVELSWKRNEETDLKGYVLSRSTDGSAFERQGQLLSLPSYTDRAVQHGKKYRYTLSAVDEKGNASDASPPVEVAY